MLQLQKMPTTSPESQSVVEQKSQLSSATTVYGHRISFFKDDIIGKKIVSKGIYEGPEIQFILHLLERIPAPVVLDIGANIGNHSLAFSQRAKRVFAFEPVSRIFSVLKRNVGDNNISNITCIRTALSNRNGTEHISVNQDGNLGASGFDKQGIKACIEEVEVAKGDDIIDRFAIDKVDFIKLDVEGHEPNVLAGLVKTIEQMQPVIMMEWRDIEGIREINSNSILRGLFSNYQAFVLTSNHEDSYWENRRFGRIRRFALRRFGEPRPRLSDFEPSKTYKNILLVPKEKLLLIEPEYFT